MVVVSPALLGPKKPKTSLSSTVKLIPVERLQAVVVAGTLLNLYCVHGYHTPHRCGAVHLIATVVAKA